MAWFDALCVLGGVTLGCVLLFAAAPRIGTLLASAIGLLVGVAVGRMEPAAYASHEWIALLVAFGAAMILIEARVPRLLILAATALTAAAALAATAILELVWASVPLAVAAVAGAWAVGCASGYALSRLRRRSYLADAALFALLLSLALMASPTALMGWQRAGIAAEGHDSPPLAPTLWVLAPVGAAFIGGFIWRAWRASRK